METTRAETRALVRQRADINTDLRRARSDLARANSSLEAAQSTLRNVQKEESEARMKAERTRAKITATKNFTEELEKENLHLEEKFNDTLRQYENATAAAELMNRNMAEAEERLATAERELEEARARSIEIPRLEEETKRAIEMTESAKLNVSVARQFLAELEKDLQMVTEMLEDVGRSVGVTASELRVGKEKNNKTEIATAQNFAVDALDEKSHDEHEEARHNCSTEDSKTRPQIDADDRAPTKEAESTTHADKEKLLTPGNSSSESDDVAQTVYSFLAQSALACIVSPVVLICCYQLRRCIRRRRQHDFSGECLDC